MLGELGPYECLSVLGEGTYGVVVKARHKTTGATVAIKQFKKLDKNHNVQKVTTREVRLLKQLRHPNIIRLIEVIRDPEEGTLHLVFEYVERTALERLEMTERGLDPDLVRRYTYQLLRCLEYCHASNVIHRDVKPENILISSQEVVKICDFGFARLMLPPSSMQSGAGYTDYVATRWYRAPELLVGQTDYTPAVDVWAVGCVFAELSTKEPLFPGSSDFDQLVQIMSCCGALPPQQMKCFQQNRYYARLKLQPPRSASHCRGLEKRFPKQSPDWIAFLSGCLQTDPSKRLTCSELLCSNYFTHDGFHIQMDEELKQRGLYLPPLAPARQCAEKRKRKVLPSSAATSGVASTAGHGARTAIRCGSRSSSGGGGGGGGIVGGGTTTAWWDGSQLVFRRGARSRLLPLPWESRLLGKTTVEGGPLTTPSAGGGKRPEGKEEWSVRDTAPAAAGDGKEGKRLEDILGAGGKEREKVPGGGGGGQRRSDEKSGHKGSYLLLFPREKDSFPPISCPPQIKSILPPPNGKGGRIGLGKDHPTRSLPPSSPPSSSGATPSPPPASVPLPLSGKESGLMPVSLLRRWRVARTKPRPSTPPQPNDDDDDDKDGGGPLSVPIPSTSSRQPLPMANKANESTRENPPLPCLSSSSISSFEWGETKAGGDATETRKAETSRHKGAIFWKKRWTHTSSTSPVDVEDGALSGTLYTSPRWKGISLTHLHQNNHHNTILPFFSASSSPPPLSSTPSSPLFSPTTPSSGVAPPPPALPAGGPTKGTAATAATAIAGGAGKDAGGGGGGGAKRGSHLHNSLLPPLAPHPNTARTSQAS